MEARARQLKRDGKLDDTWTRDGFILVKKGDSVCRITTVREIHVFNYHLMFVITVIGIQAPLSLHSYSSSIGSTVS